jgi:hypothetical protein
MDSLWIPGEWEQAKESAVELARRVELAFCLVHLDRDWVRKEAETALSELSERRMRCRTLCVGLRRSWPAGHAPRAGRSEPKPCQRLFWLCGQVEKELARRLAEKTPDRPPLLPSPPRSDLGWLQSAVLSEFVSAAPRPTKNIKRKKRTCSVPKKRGNSLRNQWIHEQILKGMSLKRIAQAIHAENPEWQPLNSPQAIHRAHRAYLRTLRNK